MAKKRIQNQTPTPFGDFLLITHDKERPNLSPLTGNFDGQIE